MWLICEKWLQDNPMQAEDKIPPDGLIEYLKNWYWVKATAGEACIGKGDTEKGNKIIAEAYEKAPEAWMKTTTKEQLDKLLPLIENSPLKYLEKRFGE